MESLLSVSDYNNQTYHNRFCSLLNVMDPIQDASEKHNVLCDNIKSNRSIDAYSRKNAKILSVTKQVSVTR